MDGGFLTNRRLHCAEEIRTKERNSLFKSKIYLFELYEAALNNIYTIIFVWKGRNH